MTQTERIVDWCSQATKDQIAWARDVKGVQNPQRLQDYEAGFRQGFMDAVALLRLQGLLKEEERR